LGLGAVLQPIGSIRSVCFGLRSGIIRIGSIRSVYLGLNSGHTTNWQYTVLVLWVQERSYKQLAV